MVCHGTSAIAYAQFGQLACSLNRLNEVPLVADVISDRVPRAVTATMKPRTANHD